MASSTLVSAEAKAHVQLIPTFLNASMFAVTYGTELTVCDIVELDGHESAESCLLY